MHAHTINCQLFKPGRKTRSSSCQVYNCRRGGMKMALWCRLQVTHPHARHPAVWQRVMRPQRSRIRSTMSALQP